MTSSFDARHGDVASVENARAGSTGGRGRRVWAVVAAPALGALLGWICLRIDVFLAVWTLEQSLPVPEEALAVYATVGAVASSLLALINFWRPVAMRGLGAWTAWITGTAALLYIVPMLERLQYAAALRLGAGGGLAATGVGAAVCGLALLGLRRLAGRWDAAAAAFAAGAALGLAVNRNVASDPFAPISLALDLLLLVLIAALALLARPRRRWVALSFAAAAVAVLVLAVELLPPGGDRRETVELAGKAPPGASNLLLVVLDTLRADVFESVVSETAEGQAFAEHLGDAAWFRNGIAAAPWTAPSVGAILTGLYPVEHGFGVRSEDPSRPLQRLAEQVPTLATRLANRGWRTEAIVTNPLLHPSSGLDRGFAHYRLLEVATSKLPLLTVLERLGWREKEIYQGADRLVARAERRLPALVDDPRPFFLWLHFMDPHEPLRAHPQLPPDAAEENLGPNERLYRQETRFVLAEVATFFQRLRAAGAFDDTLIVVVADHGEMFRSDDRDTGVLHPTTGRMLRTGHGHALYDELVRVPLVVRPAGGLPRQRDVQAVVSHVDLHDTLFDLLGVDAPRIGRDRVSVADRIVGRPRPGETTDGRWAALLSGNQHGPPMRGLRSRADKLIRVDAPQRDPELYDLRRDPDERDNLAVRHQRLRRFDEHLEELWTAQTPSEEAVDGAAMELDSETRRKLEALGYIQ
ncbi:MAG: sulfatase [Acidobacteriota bacterium]